MAVIRADGIARFLVSGWSSYPVVLVHGSDDGLIRETAARLVALAAGPDADPMNTVVLDGDALAGDPGRIADELGTFALFGGSRTVHVRGVQRMTPAMLEAAISATKSGARLVLEAGELRAGTALRALAEKAPKVAAIACYADDNKAISNLVSDVLRAHGLTIDAEARDLLTSALGNDRGLSRSEVEKLCLYAQDETIVSVEMVQDIVSDAGRHDVSGVLDRAFAGEIEGIESLANRLFAAGTAPAAVLSQAISHSLVLRRGMAGGGAESAMRLGRLHFSRKSAVARAMALWSDSRLDRALTILSSAVLQSRKTARLDEAIAVRALWAVSRLARNQAG